MTQGGEPEASRRSRPADLSDAPPAREATLGFFARSEATWLVERWVVMSAATAVIVAAYEAVGVLGAGRQADLLTSLDGEIPFIPRTVWIYFPGYVALFVLGACVIRERATFYRTMASLLLATALCLLGYALLPSPPPFSYLEADGSWTARFLAWVRRIDVPHHTFPSTHVALSFAWALGAFRYERRVGLSLLVLAAGVSVSTVTTKQHYWIDVPGGLAVALGSHWIFFRQRPL
jgi:membrane-associated phospholipid phosphatase